MINKANFKALLKHLQFEEKGDVFTKNFKTNAVFLKVDFKKEQLEYPEKAGLTINERQTCNFSQAENAVVFECVHKLLEKGYKPKHIEIEPKWKLGHGASGGRADILIKNQNDKPLLLIECKTYGKEFEKAWKETKEDGGQLFSYAQQISETEFLCLYASEFDTKNETLLVEQKIISHKDNQKILDLGEDLLSFKKASNVKRRFEVWSQTYKLEYTQTGIFEENIQAYQIGKNKYNLDLDTRAITDKDKDGKYHRFRTILRQHNIARKETAFEVLVNLFLAKIVDEEENKTDLKFYWKGIAYDNYYDFVDRLQQLYQMGMRKFLDDEIMYISNEQIDTAFWTVKNKRNATKKQIQKYFRDLKFFSNNAFSFINVHNERLFDKNAKVLVEIVQMWQNLRLKTKEQNQFLGDMFEYFLDNSIKQSEGQFFTPMPITKFIVMALPLEEKIKNASEPLRAIDYACGAGHFLTEYAHQIKPLVRKYKETDISKYYENTFGIEKEDRLAKVAKVSAYMYGQNQIKILEEDALSATEDIKAESFDVLVANPPFAVEGFLANLDDKEKESYELIKTTGKKSNTGNIQCFFIERAKQIMAPNGTAGIIVPSSILSNSDAMHIKTRELILKYFDLISIVELGSGTFGKTGTNTVILFLKRKAQKPTPAEHYQNRVEDYFECQLADVLQGHAEDKELQEYQDLGLIRKYCQHTELPFQEYIKLFALSIETFDRISELLKTDIFQDYKSDFDKSTDIKNLKKKAFFKNKSKTEQETELNKRFISYLFAIEKDKLFYFMLAVQNPQKVLIVKSPSNNKEQKQFLGYEWSGAKGSEGIKYRGGNTVNDVITPLFDPKNRNNPEKINYLIQQNFSGNPDLNTASVETEQVSYAKVEDLLDFSRKDFTKAFSLTPKKNINIETKWELVKLGEVINITNIVNGYAFKSNDLKDSLSSPNELPVLKIGNISLKNKIVLFNKASQYHNAIGLENKIVNKGDLVIALTGATVGKSGWVMNKSLLNQRVLAVKSDEKNIKYIALFILSSRFYEYAQSFAHGNAQGNLSPNQINDFKIPLPPKEIQAKIVKECEAIDQKSAQAKDVIEKMKGEIDTIISNPKFEKTKLENVFTKVNDIIKPQNETGLVNYIGLENIESNSGNLVGKTKTEYLEIKSNKTTFNKNDILYGKLRPNLNKVYLTEQSGICSTDILVFRLNEKDLTSFYKYYLLSKPFNLEVLKTVSGQQLPRTSWNKINIIKIPVPPLSEQKKLVKSIEKLEAKITTAQQILASAGEQKQAVMAKYL